MTRANLLALAARVEAAEGADRALDAEIALAAGWKQLRQAQAWWRPEHVAEARRRRKSLWGWAPRELPAFTASLDAAASLEKQEWCATIERDDAAVVVLLSVAVGGLWVKVRGAASGNHAEPRARTAAALRAMAEEASDD